MTIRLLLLLPFLLLSHPAMADPLPADVLSLEQWKLTLPFDTERPGDPDEVLPEELAKFEEAACFYVSESGDAVVFRADCDGEQTESSKYPRSELREMELNGEDEASWSTKGSDVHAMEIELAITNQPAVKPHVVCAQIHDDEDDVLMVRLEENKLFIERFKGKEIRLDSDYVLGTRFKLRIVVANGRIKAWYNDELKMDWKVSKKKCFFKAGCYTQSNLKKEKGRQGSYGEVAIYRLLLDSDS